MMARRLFVGLMLVLSSVIFAQDTNRLWSAGTAHTLPKGQWEDGLFQPLRYGLTDNTEVSLNPILGQLTPHIYFKLNRGTWRSWKVALRAGLLSPTPLLRMVRKEGTLGLLSVDPTIGDIPWIVMTRHEILLTKPWSGGLITVKVGAALALGGTEMDERHDIELPVIHPRMALFHQGFQMNMGLDLSYDLSNRIRLLADGDLLLTPGAIDNAAFEHKLLMLWNKSDRFQLAFGYKLARGNYPHGAYRPESQWHLFPLVDFQISRQR